MTLNPILKKAKREIAFLHFIQIVYIMMEILLIDNMDLQVYKIQKINLTFTTKINEKYSYFLKRISDTKNFNLDEESLFMEFEEEVLNG